MAMRWYVVHAFSQYEKKVAVCLKERIDRMRCRTVSAILLSPLKKWWR